MTIRNSRAVGRRSCRSRLGRTSARSGFTIIELIVAIVIMVVGVLGLAGTAAMVSRMVGGAGQQTVAANVAASRFEKLRSVPCSEVVDGDTVTRYMSEKWRVSDEIYSAALLMVTDTITYNAAGGSTRRLVFQSYIRCN